jgi:glucuronate isomerase
LNPQTAESIWIESNAKLAQPEFSARGVMKQMNVVLVCTTDDPVDHLAHHASIDADDSFPIKVLPTFRPDRALAVDDHVKFNVWVEKLSEASGLDVKDHFTFFIEALKNRHDFFHRQGCRLSDHAFETFDAEDYRIPEISGIFQRLRLGKAIDEDEKKKFRSAVLYELAIMNHEKGWTQQFHFGAMRNTNARMFKSLGPTAGFDSIGDVPVGRPLAKFLDRLDGDNRLAKTILYNCNPSQNDLVATIIGNFQDGRTPGKMQFGSAWWFLDQKDGMENQLNALSNQSLLSRFIGMTTDSRSFLSLARHEYFRRILCNLLGWEMKNGLLPDDLDLIGAMVKDICYHNAARHFGFDVPVV